MAGESFELVDRAAAVEAIRRMNEENLRSLNRRIVERLKLIRGRGCRCSARRARPCGPRGGRA